MQGGSSRAQVELTRPPLEGRQAGGRRSSSSTLKWVRTSQLRRLTQRDENAC
jgi:hypothetical protein